MYGFGVFLVCHEYIIYFYVDCDRTLSLTIDVCISKLKQLEFQMMLIASTRKQIDIIG